MALSLSCSLAQRQSLGLTHSLTLPFETVGDLELLSLHRIKNRIDTLEVHPSTRRSLAVALIRENLDYRVQNNHNRYCVTLNHVDSAVDSTAEFLNQESEKGLATLKEEPQLYSRVSDYMKGLTQKQVSKMKGWFSDNYDVLQYDTQSSIPYPLVLKMRQSLNDWARGEQSAMSQGIGDALEDLLKEKGLDPSSYKSDVEMWEALKQFKE